jgi:hypothetical protein
LLSGHQIRGTLREHLHPAAEETTISSSYTTVVFL